MSPILNYTTTIAAEKTIGEVQGLLAKAGASTVGLSYVGGRASGVTFSIPTTHGDRTFRLPVDPEAVRTVLERDGVKGNNKTPEQAERVAWRILKDWLEAQLALISTEMAKLDQVMLPFMTDAKGLTVYELYADQQLALGTGK